MLCIQMCLHIFSDVFKNHGCFLAQVMHAPVNIAVFLFIIICNAVDNTPGFLSSSSIIKVNQWLAINALFESREIVSYMFNIETQDNEVLYYKVKKLMTQIKLECMAIS